MCKRAKDKYKRAKIFRLCGENLKREEMKFSDQCHLTGRNRGAALRSSNLNVEKGESSFAPDVRRKISKNDCDLFIKTLISDSSSNKL